jgi:hypothetical protein
MASSARKLVGFVAFVALIAFDFTLVAVMRIGIQPFRPFGDLGIRRMAGEALCLDDWFLCPFAVTLRTRKPPLHVPVGCERLCLLCM